ncbi:MAG: hypothetical protein VXW32_00960 [Myxococcota bacterium]|nr:hypothetical protein [Myxococcota bacterium]
MKTRFFRFTLFCWMALGGCSTPTPEDSGPPEECSEEAFQAVTDYLLQPVFEDANPWTCSQCHDASITPRMWERQTACQTMACLSDSAIVDFEEVGESKLIFFIHQAEAFGNISTDLSLIRQGELLARMHLESEAYSRWILYASECFETACSEEAQDYEDTCSFELDWGNCDPDEGMERFEEAIYDPMMEQCADCHSAAGTRADEHDNAPRFLEEDLAAGPAVTLSALVEHFLISLAEPATSKILTRPLTQGVSAQTALGEVTGVWHGGGDLWDSSEVMLQSAANWIAEYTTCLSP